MRAQCGCGGGISTFRLSVYRDWRDNHVCATLATQEEPSEVDQKGGAYLELSGQWDGDYDSCYRTLPGVNARRIGFQPE